MTAVQTRIGLSVAALLLGFSCAHDPGPSLSPNGTRSSLSVEIDASQQNGIAVLQRVRDFHMADRAVDDTALRSLRFVGPVYERSQSRSIDPPYDRFEIEEELLFNADGSRFALDQHFHWPNFTSRYRTVRDGERTFELDLNGQSIVDPYLAPEEVWIRKLVAIPGLLAEQLLSAPNAVRFMGVSADDGHRFVEGNAGDQRLRLQVDARDRIRAVSRLVPRALLGDAVELTELIGEQEIDGMLVPQEMRRSIDGELVADLEIKIGTVADVARFEIPADFREPTLQQSELELTQLAPDVWLVRNIGGADYNSLVVQHDEGLVVLETPQSEQAMDEVFELLDERFAEVLIRAAVVTHHHYDHSGGVRSAMKKGATILAPPGSSDFFLTVATAPRTLQPGSEAIVSERIRIEEVEDATIIASHRGPTIHLYSLSDNEHADGMLFAWIPDRGILFQGDLFVKRGDEIEPARPQAVAFLKKLELMNIDPAHLVGVHGEIATLDDLQQSVDRRLAGEVQ